MSVHSSYGKTMFIAANFILVLWRLGDVAGVGSKISYNRLSHMKGIPGLGRGYSMITNSLQQTCFDIHESKEEKSFDYEKYFTDLGSGDASLLKGKIANSFAVDRIREILTETRQLNNRKQILQDMQMANNGTMVDENSFLMKNVKTRRYNVAITLRSDGLYSSIQEDKVQLSGPAKAMLRDGEYINFFVSCGSYYIRSLHRAQETTAIISFETDDSEKAKSFTKTLELYASGNPGKTINTKLKNGETPSADDMQSMGFDMDLNFDHIPIKHSLTIEIFSYGLSLHKEAGANHLVSTSLNELNHAMTYAFNSMTRTSNDHNSHTGMVYSMMVVPWVDNAEFLIAADVSDRNRIMVPVPRNLINTPKVLVTLSGEHDLVCRSPSHGIDDFGKCCDEADIKILEVTPKEEENDTSSAKRSCEPVKQLSSAIMKEYMQKNAEFVSWISSIAREKVKILSNHDQCVKTLNSFPDRHGYFYVRSNDEMEYHDESLKFTVKELQAALDPTGDNSVVDLISNENDEYFEMFHNPCLAALYSMDGGEGKPRDIDPKYFMAQPWYKIKECARTSCLNRNAAWDRLTGNGCINGLLGRESSDSTIPLDSDPFCAKALDKSTGAMSCKYNKLESSRNIVMQIDNCRESLPRAEDGRGTTVPLAMGDLIDYFCMPQVALDEDEADDEQMLVVDGTLEKCTQEIDDFLPSVFPSSAPSNIKSSVPSSTPSNIESSVPSSTPSIQQSSQPSLTPTTFYSSHPSSQPSFAELYTPDGGYDSTTSSAVSMREEIVSLAHSNADYAAYSGSFDFAVKASNDAHIYLHEDSTSKYMIAIGGWSNTQSVIRDIRAGTVVNLHGPVDTLNYLSSSAYFNFRVSWDASSISVWRYNHDSNTWYSSPFLNANRYANDDFDRFLAWTGHGSDGYWRLLETNIVYKLFTYSSPNGWDSGAGVSERKELSNFAHSDANTRPYYVSFDFEVAADNDVHVFLYEGSTPKYAIIIGGWDDTESVIRDIRDNTYTDLFTPVSTADYLSASSLRTFRVSWDPLYNYLSVWRYNHDTNAWYSSAFMGTTRFDGDYFDRVLVWTGYGSDGYWEMLETNIVNKLFTYSSPNQWDSDAGVSERKELSNFAHSDANTRPYYVSFDFEVAADNDASIFLYEGSTPKYELLIGGWDDTESVIRDIRDNTFTDLFTPVSTANYLSASALRTFRVSWDPLYNYLSVWRYNHDTNAWYSSAFMGTTRFDGDYFDRVLVWTGYGSDGYWEMLETNIVYKLFTYSSPNQWDSDAGVSERIELSNFANANTQVSSGSFDFEVAADNDASIFLYEGSTPKYELLIAGWDNTESVIRDLRDNANADLFTPVSTANYLSASALRTFRVSWDASTISVWRYNHDTNAWYTSAFMGIDRLTNDYFDRVLVWTGYGSDGYWESLDINIVYT